MVSKGNRPFAGYDHMVQNPPYWNANCALGHPKQSDLNHSIAQFAFQYGGFKGLLLRMSEYDNHDTCVP